MMTESEIRSVCQRALELSPASATEVRIAATRSGLTRLANSEVSQSIDADRVGLMVKVLLGPASQPNRVGVASTNRLDDKGLAEVLGRAEAAARMQHEDPSLLPPVGPQAHQPADRFDRAAANCPPGRRAELLADVLRRCRRDGLDCAGAFSLAATARGIASSAGLFAFDQRTEAELSLTVSRDGISGWHEVVSHRLGDIDPAAVAERAIDIARRGGDPGTIEPGHYTVVLPSLAVQDLLWFLAVGGLATKAILEGRSFFSGKPGQKVFGQNITIADDAYDPLTGGLPFDGEGLPRKRVTLIDRGMFVAMVHGRETARLAGAEPTGHGLTPPSSEGALPANLVLAPGEASLDGMIRSVKRGLLVTHLHYTNMLRPTDLTITGMTRDGLFLIEDGRVTRPVRNMRFTESLVRVFSNVEMVGSRPESVGGVGVGFFSVPALLVREFNFSSATEF